MSATTYEPAFGTAPLLAYRCSSDGHTLSTSAREQNCAMNLPGPPPMRTSSASENGPSSPRARSKVSSNWRTTSRARKLHSSSTAILRSPLRALMQARSCPKVQLSPEARCSTCESSAVRTSTPPRSDDLRISSWRCARRSWLLRSDSGARGISSRRTIGFNDLDRSARKELKRGELVVELDGDCSTAGSKSVDADGHSVPSCSKRRAACDAPLIVERFGVSTPDSAAFRLVLIAVQCAESVGGPESGRDEPGERSSSCSSCSESEDNRCKVLPCSGESVESLRGTVGLVAATRVDAGSLVLLFGEQGANSSLVTIALDGENERATEATVSCLGLEFAAADVYSDAFS
mmetsp:Transcript_1536/g.4099  ORF Transcript_1536/g.4099 Transcript_1536/m.4099 type:complete len:348 (+) Transcript_1536:272-1315(+)